MIIINCFYVFSCFREKLMHHGPWIYLQPWMLRDACKLFLTVGAIGGEKGERERSWETGCPFCSDLGA